MAIGINELKTFMEERLLEFDPTIDINPGSPAQSQIIEPLLSRLGTDPFDLDIKEFMYQRGREFYPDLDLITYDDLFLNPLSTFLEPFNREIQRISKAQSIQNSDTINQDEVDAILANYYMLRQKGTKCIVPVRIYFQSPQAVTISTTNRVYSKSNLLFFPINDYSFTVNDITFNREGNRYYVDITVESEKEGSQYSVEIDDFSDTDILGAVGVKNFTVAQGTDGDTNQQFIERGEVSLNERSLNTERGIRSQLTSPKAISIIGAREKGMDRDILKGTGEGYLYLSTIATIINNWMIIKNINYKDQNVGIEVGDEVRLQKPLNVDPNRNIIKVKVKSIWWNSGDKYLLEISENLGISDSLCNFFKPGYITISEIPGGMLSTQVLDNSVHLGGHVDIFTRPAGTDKQNLTLKTINGDPILALQRAKIFQDTNAFNCDDAVAILNLVLPEDVISIESGNNVGIYKVIEINNNIRVDRNFTQTETNLRARIYRQLKTNLNIPIKIKVPYAGLAQDLTTVAGSLLFKTSTNLINYGVEVGDKFEVLSGMDKGIYTIQKFDPILLGNGPILDRAATTSSNNVSYRVYSTQTGITLPLININKIEVLDSNLQATGNEIPYGKPVGIYNECEFSKEQAKSVYSKTLMICPDFASIFPINSDPAVPGTGVDARYTQKIEEYDGTIRKIGADNTNPITSIEINLPPFLWNGKRDKLIALVSEIDLEFNNDPANNAQTSPLVKAKNGWVVSIKDGPCIGNYLIKDVRIFNLWNKTTAGHQKIALIQLYDELPSDFIRTVYDFISYGNQNGSGISVPTQTEMFGFFEWLTDPDNNGGCLVNILLQKLINTFTFFGFTMNLFDGYDLILNNSRSSYSTGPAPKGILRNYFMNPVGVEYFSEQYTPTWFVHNNKLARPIESNSQVVPQSLDQSVTGWLRNGSMKSPIDTSYYLVDGDTFAKRGAKTGDLLQYYLAINDYPSRHKMNSSYVGLTQIDSDIVTIVLPNTRNNPKYLEPGLLLCIDSGPDQGTYKIVSVISSTFPTYKVRIDKKLTHTTLNYPDGWALLNPQVNNIVHSTKNVLCPGFILAAAVGGWVSIIAVNHSEIMTAGEDEAYLGTFKITTVDALNNLITLDRTANFPTTGSNPTCLLVFHPAPTTTPAQTSGGGTELTTQYVRVRLYDNTLIEKSITVDWNTNPNPLNQTSKNQIILSSNFNSPTFSHKSPIRIIRKNSIKIGATEMANYKDNGLYYIDIPVRLIGLDDGYNFSEFTSFDLSGKYRIDGWQLKTKNKNLSYSLRENLDLILSPSFIPKGLEGEENSINLLNKNINIIYNNSSEIISLQNYVDLTSNRILCSDLLIRHFLPAFLLLDIEYSGGSDSSVISQDLITAIINISTTSTELRSDYLIKLLQRRGAKNIKQPLLLQALVHDLNHTIKYIRSTNSLGLVDPIFDGLNKQVYWIPGEDLSNKDRVDGGGIKITKI